jgi:TrmH family RNA methyltransferase
MITSKKNPKIQWTRNLITSSKERRLENCFVVEGIRLVEESLLSGWKTRVVFYTPEIDDRGLAVITRYQDLGVEIEQVSKDVMQSVSDTDTPQGILVVLEREELPLPERIGFLIILDQIRDPGNLGMILRTAAAAAVDAVILSPGSVDPFSPKVVRSGMGAHFHVPLRFASWDEIYAFKKEHGLTVFLSVPADGILYYMADYRTPIALIVGGESHGAGERAYEAADQKVHIPLSRGVESLNAAAAASIIMYEVVRQRDSKN